MEGYKLSHYTISFEYPEYGNHVIYYNSLSNASLLVSPQIHKRIIAMPKKFGAEDFEENYRNVFEVFLNKRLIIGEEVHELEILKKRLLLGRGQRKIVMATVAPTNQCNFRCSYCFEPHVNAFMSDNTWSSFVEHIKKEEEMEVLGLTWFGGEPLLCAKNLVKWTKDLKEGLQGRKVKYQGSMVTNGYLLTKQNLKILRDVDVQSIQITLDGPGEIHDTRRPLASGKGTYERIVGNLVSNQEDFKNIRVTIRVNVDQRNIENIKDLINDLSCRGISRWCDLYLARVESPTIYCGDIQSKCFRADAFAGIYAELLQHLKNAGFNNVNYPTPVLSFCGADNDASFVMDANGFMYKCWHDIGNSEKAFQHISNLSEHKPFPEKNYRDETILEQPPCSHCQYVPICMGGCPYYRAVNGTGDLPCRSCTEYKTNLRQKLALKFEPQLNETQ